MQINALDGGLWNVDFGEEIGKGADWLTEQDPRWFDKINLDSLHLESPKQCVLGQLAMTSFASQVTQNLLGGWMGYDAVLLSFEFTHQWASEHGFNLDTSWAASQLNMAEEDLGDPDDHSNKYLWEQLTFQWAERIEKSRAEAGTMVASSN